MIQNESKGDFFMDILASDKAIWSCFKKYAVFKGRANRFEFWSFFLFYVFVSVVLGIIPFVKVIAGILSLACLLPYLAVTVRRLHDTGKSWVWILLPLVGILFFIPAIFSADGDIEDLITYGLVWVLIGGILYLAGEIVLIVFCAQASQKGENKYGPEPVNNGFTADEKKKTDTDELKKLKNLLDDGVITQEDYNKKKKDLLGL